MSSATTDKTVQEVQNVLRKYEENYPESRVSVRRYNSVSVRVRIIDPGFGRLNQDQREDRAWQVLDDLSDDAVSELTLLVLITPDEISQSLANLEFDNPSPTFP